MSLKDKFRKNDQEIEATEIDAEAKAVEDDEVTTEVVPATKDESRPL
jgi:hypothetical protein